MQSDMTRVAAIGIFLLMGLTACATIKIVGTVPVPGDLKPSGTFRAGAAKVDLTPMPGFPTGGHGPAGATARGYWTRLFAHAIYLEDTSGRSMVLVSCDLWSIPAGLSDRVAELVGTEAEARHIGRHQIILAATHTHHGPGNFSSSKMYNAFASRQIGFAQDLFEFLAHRIAAAILKAVKDAQPATAQLLETRVPGLMRNRSFEAFMLNPEHERKRILRENAKKYREDRYHAVDPGLAVLKVQTASNPAHTIAIAAFVAVHPTSMSNSTAVYNSDLFGVAATVAEHALHAGADPSLPPVVAIFNGAEGDISPDWKRQDRRNTLRLGRLLGHCIVKLSTGSNKGGKCSPSEVPRRVDGAIDYRFTIAQLSERCFKDGPNPERCTADNPLPGVAMQGGAEDGRTLLYELGWKEGVTGSRQYPDQGSKHPALDIRVDPQVLPPLLQSFLKDLTRRKVSPSDVPREVPLGIYRLGPVAIATLPGEFTMVMGRRIAESIKQAMEPEPARVILVGLANEYLSYFTTPEEYEAQHYEGASTLYGPASGPLVRHELRLLVQRFTEPPSRDGARDFRYRAGAQKKFSLRDIGELPYFPDDGLANVLQDLNNGQPIRDFPRYCWKDKIPVLSIPDDEKVRVTPRVAIERKEGQNSWKTLVIQEFEETDEGLDFVTVALAASDRSSRWCAFWMPPAGLDRSMKFRFRVDTMRGLRIWSSPFQVQD
ncbi:MAG: neutral/alkaline non-lysosomal ceramidase N-terminal domain-containing protein [Terriglobia bacterium]